MVTTTTDVNPTLAKGTITLKSQQYDECIVDMLKFKEFVVLWISNMSVKMTINIEIEFYEATRNFNACCTTASSAQPRQFIML